MRAYLHLLKLEILHSLRSNFHYVLLLTAAAIIGTYYALPDVVAGSQLQNIEGLSLLYLSPVHTESLRDCMQ